ncbi:hypothetical protein SAMN04488519_10214 [Algoriphagus ornithinivorans]|uniref:Uncharacterized protein n=2 Tax=Algoriphagus ornithinivorans TaxID=226506 RepID=A0A1I5BRU6_9BACT|nr:hypothetical protein SAMN04488519_10214 [Algoriphagus ornithinivorans]
MAQNAVGMNDFLALSSTGRHPFQWLEIRNIERVWNAVGMTDFTKRINRDENAR